MNQLAMAYLPITNLQNALTACMSADSVRMDESVLYWELVTPTTAKYQNAYIVDELLAVMGTEPEQVHYHIIKWDEHHQAFLVLFASNFDRANCGTPKLAPNQAFFESHMLYLLKYMSIHQVLVTHYKNDGTLRYITSSMEGFMYSNGNSATISKEAENIVKRMWNTNMYVFQWCVELRCMVHGVAEPIYITSGNYHRIMAK